LLLKHIASFISDESRISLQVFKVFLQVYVLFCLKEQSPITACFHGKPENNYRPSAKLEKVAADLEDWKEHLKPA